VPGAKDAVQLDSVSVQLNGRQILRELTAAIPAGAITGLLGPSGAGKTTLMRVIVGLQRADGQATVLELKAGNPGLRHQLGYMTQAASVYQDLTVDENLGYFAALVGAGSAELQAIRDKVGLSSHRQQLISNLSGGERTRVSLAAALLGRPRLLVLDEPTVGLDPVLRASLWQQFRELAAAGTSLVVSSHVMDEAEHCDHLLLLREGRLIATGSPAAIMKRTKTQRMEAAFLSLVGEAV
jgi:ABC-2 type transport system ATP-binding protein